MRHRIGFMQGRLSPPVNGKIQAFPAQHWRDEFATARELGLSLMEWTIDHADFLDNPLLTASGRAEIRALRQAHGVRIASLTADTMMQAPFWKAGLEARAALRREFAALIEACAELAIGLIVVPLVDNGALTAPAHEDTLLEGMREALPVLEARGVRVAFESDFEPERLASFMRRFPVPVFGVNFDMGNSAALGWEPAREIPVLAPRIVNVHVKDRPRGGSTVPFGQGDVDFATVFRLLGEAGYEGAYILQGARAPDGDDAGILRQYVRRVEGVLNGL